MPPTLQLLAEHGEEDGEVDGTAGLLDRSSRYALLRVFFYSPHPPPCAHTCLQFLIKSPSARLFFVI